jgi:simple sugar transport system substrate-binding protein
MSRFSKVLMLIALMAVAVAGFAHPVNAQNKRPYRIVVITHGQASDPFWSVVKRGVDQAAVDMRVTVEYQAPSSFDMPAMAKLIDAAVASKPNGLVVSVPDAEALGKSIQAAVKAGIPVISINSGSDAAAKLGVLAHVGQTEYEAGLGGGERMAAAGAKNALCVNQEVGNAGLDLRCKGFTDAMKKAGGKVAILAVDLADPTGSQNKISAALTSDPTIDSILTLGPTGAGPALSALKKDGKLGKIKIGTFDLSPEVLEAIKAGDMLFAIDQQQYTQGYLSVVYMTLYLSNLNTPGNLLIPTGPGFVTKETADRVISLSKDGTR